MFTSQIAAVLKNVVLEAEDDKRMARCTLHVDLTYELAKELSPKIADRLYRVNGTHEFIPCSEVTGMEFSCSEIARQRMEFRAAPEVVNAGGMFTAVSICGLVAYRPKRKYEFALALTIQFEIVDRATAARFVFDYLKQTVFLQFQPQQRALPLEHHKEQPLGKFINDKAHRRQTGFSDSPRPGAAV